MTTQKVLLLNDERLGLDENMNLEPKKPYKREIVWSSTILLALLHIGGVYGAYLKKTDSYMVTTIYGTFLIVIAGLGITAGAHRLWTHRCYKANYTVQIIYLCLESLTYQKSVYNWCRDHRVHHKFSETDADPHNAKRGFFFSHMGWLMLRKHPDVLEKGKTVDLSDLEANPLIMFQHKYYHYFIFFTAFVFPTLVPWYFWNESLKTCIFGVAIYRYVMSLHITWSVNSFAHLYGQKPYDKEIGPSESIVPIIFTLGEGYHNYHHTFPYDYRASEYNSYVSNYTTAVIDMFAKIGWVTDLKTAPEQSIQKRIDRTGDGSNPIHDKLGWLYFLSLWIFVIYIF